ncbi:MAG: thioesterase family protein [Hyphomonadaceae bacterium]
MTAFADTIILDASGSNAWTGAADPAYAHPGGRFGGWTAAALLTAAMREPGDRGDPLSLTVLFTDAVNDGDIEIATRQLRTGARLQFWRAELHQSEKVCAHAQITFGKRRETLAFTDLEMPDVPPAEDASLAEGSPSAPFGEQLIGRWVSTMPFEQRPDPSAKARSLFWCRHRDGLRMDHVLLACLLDYAPPRIMYRRDGFPMSSTVSMNAYFHVTPEEIAEVGDGWVLSDVACRRCEGGYYDHEIRMWSPSGALLATSEQVAAFRD